MSTNPKAPSEADPVDGLTISDRPGGARFSIHAKPRASKSKVLGVRDGSLDVAIAAPPVDGEANEEIRKLLARALDLARRDVEIVAGATGKSKIVEVGLSALDTRARLAKLLGEGRSR